MTDQTSASTATPVSGIQYAPQQPVVKGNLKLACIGIKWQDHPPVSEGSISTMCNNIAATYKNLSDGQLTFSPTAMTLPVNLNRAAKNITKAEQIVINEAKSRGHKADIYAIVNDGATSQDSHAGGDIAHLRGTLLRTAYHEVGHLAPFNLGHAGKYDLVNGKAVHLDHYGDGSSFMGKFATNKLNSPQMYSLGWLPKEKVALLPNMDSAPIGTSAEFEIEPLFTKSPSSTAVKGVLIPTNFRSMYLWATPNDKNIGMALDFIINDGSGSQQIGNTFGNELKFNGLYFQRKTTGSSNGNSVTMTITKISDLPGSSSVPADSTDSPTSTDTPATNTPKPKL